MGDMSDTFTAMRKEGQAKRASNRESSAKLLQDAGIPFERKNGGAHLIVAGRYDFWPGTGVWIVREDGTKSRGVRKLIARVKGARHG